MINLISLHIDGLEGEVDPYIGEANTSITGNIVVIDRETTQECCIFPFKAVVERIYREHPTTGLRELFNDFDRLYIEQDIVSVALVRLRAELAKIGTNGVDNNVNDAVMSFLTTLVKSKGKISLVVYDAVYQPLS